MLMTIPSSAPENQPETLRYSTLRQKARLDLCEAVPLNGPLAVYIEPTNICNFKCVFCPESFKNFEEKSGGFFRLSLSDFEKIADQLALLGSVKTVNFYMMGEPFANSNLLQFTKIAKERGIGERVIVTTNGSLLREKIHADICNSGIDFLRVSIYGANQRTHLQHTQSRVALAKIQENVRKLKTFRDTHGFRTPHIYTKMIRSLDEVENNQFLQSFGEIADEICLEPVMNWNDPEEGNLTQQESADWQNDPFFAKRKLACSFPFYTMVIHSDLRVSPCCVDWDKQLIVGDLKVQSLHDIWNSPKWEALRIAHLNHQRGEIPGCRNCSYLHTAPDNIDKLTEAEYKKR